jgi:hypothetical protein
MSPQQRCTAATRAGRLRKAIQFVEAAETLSAFADDEADVGDAYVTLLVHGGVAAADVLCCARLGQHASGNSHTEAVALLRTVDRNLAGDLDTLLGMKTRSGYSHQATSRTDRARAARAAARLLDAARMT